MSDSVARFPTFALMAEHLACRRGDLRVFEDVSFTVGNGQALIVTGPNGSGKSSLIRIIAGLGRAESGRVRWHDQGESESAHDHAARLRYVGHQDGLKSALTVYENLSFWAAIYDTDQHAVEAAIGTFDLHPVADLPAGVLSAGWRRRAGLARLLLGHVPLWLLDEPFNALDAANQGRLTHLMSEHMKAGGLIVMATHQQTGLAVEQHLDMAAFPPKPRENVW